MMSEAAKIKRAEYMRNYRKKNAEKIKEYNANWRKNNPDKIKKNQVNYWERLAAKE